MKPGKYFIPALFLTCLYLSPALRAQDTLKTDTIDYYEMSLEQLLNIKTHGVPSELEQLINQLIAAASNKPLSTRESPNIVSLITGEEIRNSGARDLIDVLRLIPGIDFGVDVEGVVGIATRGLWAHEGKVLVLLDGQEMNEILFATTQFGNHFPIDQIKKIEIVRGPGSAIYGGFAEYGVINIVTQSGGELNGVAFSGIYGQMQNDFGRNNYNLSLGKKINDLEFSLSGFLGKANRSDQDYEDFYGGSYNMAGNSNLNPTLLNLGLSYKGWSCRVMADLYETSVRDAYDLVKDDAYREDFQSYFAELKYVYKKGDKFSITPRLNYKRQMPWKTLNVDSLTPDYNKVAERYSANLMFSYNFTRKINLSTGAEFYMDKATDLADSSFFANGEQQVSYYNQAYFAQLLARTHIVNFILGARFDMHNEYGSAFVPRVGFTKKIKRFNFKFLVSNSFRAPSIENINLSDSTGIKPEKTSFIELEAGYQFTRSSILTFNFFDITTRDPIVYYYDDSLMTDNYHNFGGSGSRGIEVEYRVRGKWGYVTLNYSFYTVAGKEKITDYEVSDNDKVLLAFPAHKAGFNSSFNIGKHISLNPSFNYRGRTYGYTAADSLDNTIVSEFEAVYLANVFVRFRDVLTPGLSFGVGVYDILNQRPVFIQPYNGYHAPLPGPSREIIFRLSYNLLFKNKKS
ncbi:MAG: TonB-dependent receptor plug domain-containing protein [Bacteroidota bacterium]